MRELEAIVREGLEHHKAGRLAEAAHIYDKVLSFSDAREPNVLHAYGSMLLDQGQPGLAQALLYRSIEMEPKYPATWCNLGISLMRAGRDKAAFAAYQTALELEPEGEEVLSNLAGWYVNRGQPENIIRYAKRCVELYPDNCHAHNQLALGYLEAGDLEHGLPEYEWRWKVPQQQRFVRPFMCPKWTGDRVKLLAIHGEQGLGDEIMFMSVLPKVLERVDAVVIEAATRLVPLFKYNWMVTREAVRSDIDRDKILGVYPRHEDLIAAAKCGGLEVDAYIGMGSLFNVVGLPDRKPYLKAPRKMQRNGKPVVGIAWKGGTDRTHKRERSIPLSALAPLFQLENITFVPVQYGGDDVEHEWAGGNYPRDFEALTERIAACDLVISVLQTAVHQAGSMGVECWGLAPKACPWVFSAAHGDKALWYDCVTLYRQEEMGEWGPVIERVAADLRKRFT